MTTTEKINVDLAIDFVEQMRGAHGKKPKQKPHVSWSNFDSVCLKNYITLPVLVDFVTEPSFKIMHKMWSTLSLR